MSWDYMRIRCSICINKITNYYYNLLLYLWVYDLFTTTMFLSWCLYNILYQSIFHRQIVLNCSMARVKELKWISISCVDYILHLSININIYLLFNLLNVRENLFLGIEEINFLVPRHSIIHDKSSNKKIIQVKIFFKNKMVRLGANII